jgi:hypothetical protein
MRKVLRKGLLADAVRAVTAQWHEIVRYLRIEQMSLGRGHPENVPARGSHSYPAPGRGAPDGTGDFDSAGRGGGSPLARP